MTEYRGVRAAIIGCGRMGRVRAHAAAGRGCKIAYVCDPDTARAVALAREMPGAIVLESTENLDWRGIDVAFICGPPSSHVPLAIEAIKNKVAALIEKPVALSLDDARTLLTAHELMPGRTCVGYMTRCRPSIRELRRMLDADPAPLVNAYWVNAPYAVPWWIDSSRSGGPFREQATHMVDLLIYLFGSVKVVGGIQASSGSHCRAVASIEFDNGTLASLCYGSHSTLKTIGAMFYRQADTLQLSGWEFNLSSSSDGAIVEDDHQRDWIFDVETGLFLDYALGGRLDDRISTVESAFYTQKIVDDLVAAFETIPSKGSFSQ